MRCLVLGSGPMGQDHVKVLRAFSDCKTAVFAPSDKNKTVIEGLEVPFYSGDLTQAIRDFKPTHAIVASPIEKLASTGLRLMREGVQNILLEKPGFMTLKEAAELETAAAQTKTQVSVAYNRRFYASVLTAQSLIKDGNETLKNVHIEFTEWSHQIEKLDYFAPQVKAHWALANSAHVIDLGFLPTGLPVESKSAFYRSGSLAWHPSAAVMTGAGETSSGALFSYVANWASPGRWSVEWVTDKHRYIFKPIEKLRRVKIGSVAEEEIPLLNDYDERFKPGLYLQNEAFLGAKPAAVTLRDATGLAKTVAHIAGYSI